MVPPLLISVAGIICGASAGALLRWGLGLWLNPLSPHLQYGTLAANWLGCLLMGMLMHALAQDTYRLLIVTGFLGSFTTLSAFSAETLEKLLQGRWQQALLLLVLHSAGGVFCTLIGWLFWRFAVKHPS